MSPDRGVPGTDGNSAANAALIAAAKAELRRQILRRRAALSPQVQRDAALALQPHLLQFLQQQCAAASRPLHVAVYAPFRGELAFGGDWQPLLELPIQLYFPKIVTTRQPHWLQMVALPPGSHPDDWLRPGHFGVPEPPSAEIRTEAGRGDPARSPSCPPLDLVLLPGLAFDRRGGRLGWGKAYYDRFLASCRPLPATAGIGYDFQLLDQDLPQQPHDVRLDWLITPSGVIAAGTVQMC